ncbi:MAG: tRNA (adenosine(37)-N6)-threonylcarbamoyltransferase complex ATPase subunit type 1 TsaE [Bryobacteraceae bacterium]
MTVDFTTGSADETIELGRRLARKLPSRGLVLLIGGLGAGKTTLVKGIAEGRGAAPREEVSSPTFALIHEYGDPVAVYHADLYRLDAEDEAARLGLDELLEAPALVLVEWGERFPRLWPDDRTEIRIEAEGDDQRRFRIRSAKAS